MKRTKTYGLSDQYNAYKKLNRLLTYLLAVIFFVFVAGAITYAERFRFWDDALSYLGKIKPVNGRSNLLSFLIFSSGMIFSSYLCFRISQKLKGFKEQYYYMLAGTGFILLAIPTDLVNIVHTLGGAFVVGSFWFYTLKNLVELYHKDKSYRIFLYHLILHGTVIPYAVLYASGTSIRQGAQKIAVLGLVIILKISVIEYLQYLEKQKSVQQNGNW